MSIIGIVHMCVFTCVSSGKYIEKCVFSDQVVFISLIVLFFPRQGFEQDLENGYPQYPDTCHGEWRSVSSVMPLLLSLLLYYTNCSQNVFRWHPHLDLQVFFSRTPYYKWQTCFCPLTLFENTFMYKGILLLTNLWYWYII